MFILMCYFDDIVNNIVHRTIKMKPIDVTTDSNAETMKIRVKKS